ncbi:MAG: SDR family NAD(P)-dependent oxidoreductase, partial [Spirochaetales bacterium]|nr:SDR family NAD(P)-dependent oxidoreductase [Spirochaetales bacterium]
MEKELNGHSAIVTGGAQGIGKAIAAELASRGANIAICDVNEKALQETAGEIGSKTGAKVFVKVVDISKKALVDAFV